MSSRWVGSGEACAAALLLALALPAATAQAEGNVVREFLRKVIGFSDAQIGAVDAGQVVTKQLSAADKPESAAFGAVRLNGDHVALVRQSFMRGAAMKRKSKLAIAIVSAVLGGGGTAAYAQLKYSLLSPGGIAFADFKGYEDWAMVSSARTDEVLKVIVANPTMISAYKAGVPGNGQPFPDGSKIVKLQWKPKQSKDAPFVVDVPDVFTQAFVIEKDSKRFPKSGGWGYALFNYDAASDEFSADPKSLADCGHSCHSAVKSKDYIFHPYQKR